MRRVRAIRLVAALLLPALAGAGCAARWAYRQGQEARDKGDWDLAVARYTRALERDPNNITYKIALENARVQASRLHYDQARKQIAASDFAKAIEELDIASKYDPSNRSASDDLAIVRQRLQKQEDEARDRAEFEEKRARARAARLPLPVLSPRSAVPITLNFRDGSLQKILESLGRLAGVNVLFDEGFRDKRTDVNLSGLRFQEALERLTMVHRLFYKVLDQNTIIIVPESRQKRLAYDELVMRTFYVQNAEVPDTVNLIKTLAKVTTVMPNASLGAITIVGTVEQVAMAEHIIEANDKARGEVLVEVQILEVNRVAAKQWGLDLSNYTASATLSPTGSANEVSGGILSIRPQFLSSLNQADWIVSLPSTLFTRFIQSDSTTRILASPRLRAAEGKKAELKIGQEVPVPMTTYTVGVGSVGNTGSYFPATSFQYRNVGVTMELTPAVSASGDIRLELKAEFSLLGADRNVGTTGNPLLVPTFLSRSVSAVLRLRDGETGLIGGLLQGTDASSFAGSLGMNSIPIIGKLFGDRRKSRDESEVLISITPRIVRGPKITEDDLVPLAVGTQEVPKVAGSRPALFAPEAPAPATPGAPPAAQGGGVPNPPAAAPAGVQPLAAPGTAVPETVTPMAPPAGATALPAASAPASASPAAASPGGASQVPAADARPASALVSPPEVAVRAGQSTGVAVLLVGARDVQWVELTLTYDATLFRVTDVAAGALLTLDGSPVHAERQLESGRARVRFARTTGASGSGAIAAITLQGEKAGSGALSVESLVVGRASGSERPALPPAARVVVAP